MRHGGTWKGGCSREYRSWCAMKTRCFNRNAPNFYKYGGRGVTVCRRWVESFAAFLADMGPRPEGTTLDRIDKCSRFLTIGSETATITEWARRAGVSDTAMLYRVRRGLTGAALLRPSHHGKAL